MATFGSSNKWKSGPVILPRIGGARRHRPGLPLVDTARRTFYWGLMVGAGEQTWGELSTAPKQEFHTPIWMKLRCQSLLGISLARNPLLYIADPLHDRPETPGECCLVSKSDPRTRKHLFADIKFRPVGDLAESRKAVPDPSNSPVYHTHTRLTVCCTQSVVAEVGDSILTFAQRCSACFGDSLTSFHKSSPVLESLRTYSSVLLEDMKDPRK